MKSSSLTGKKWFIVQARFLKLHHISYIEYWQDKTEKSFSNLAASQFCFSRSNKSTATLQFCFLQGCVIVALQGCIIVALQGCVIVVLQDCVIVALQGCVIVVWQGCVLLRCKVALFLCYNVALLLCCTMLMLKISATQWPSIELD
jgi:hypothetical protein